MEPLQQLKEAAKAMWAPFAPMEVFTAQAAPALVRFAKIAPGARVLDVACGTGPVAITAARLGAKVTGADIAPELVATAKRHAQLAGVEVAFAEADAEQLPYGDASFDVVVSQYGHMFAPRPEAAVGEMLRVLRPGGTIAFSTWPPDVFVGRLFSTAARHLPPPPMPVQPPGLWGDPNVVRERLGNKVRDLTFDRGDMTVYALSPQHLRVTFEGFGPLARFVASTPPGDPKLAAMRADIDALIAEYWDDRRNGLRQDFLMSRAVKL